MTSLYSPPPPTNEELAALFTRVANAPQFLSGILTVDTLPAPTAELAGIYARVSDLFGDKRDVVICTGFMLGGSLTYRWEPLRPDYAKTITPTTQTLQPLKSPPSLLLVGTLLSNVTLTFGLDGAWPGSYREIAYDGNVGLFGLNLLVPGITGLVSLLNGGRKRFVFDGTAYKQVST